MAGSLRGGSIPPQRRHIGPSGHRVADDAIAQVLNDPDSKTRAFIAKQYPPGPVLVAGDALKAQLEATLEANKKLLEIVK